MAQNLQSIFLHFSKAIVLPFYVQMPENLKYFSTFFQGYSLTVLSEMADHLKYIFLPFSKGIVLPMSARMAQNLQNIFLPCSKAIVLPF